MRPLLVVLGITLALAAPATADDAALLETAGKLAAKRAHDALEAKVPAEIVRIAILPLDGDKEHGEVGNLLGFALSGKRFQGVVRGEALERLLEEHDFVYEYKPILDGDTVDRLGEILGVQGLVYGQVTARGVEAEGATVRIHVTLSQVLTGEFWGESVEGFAPAPPAPPPPFPWRRTGILAAAAVVLVLIVRAARRAARAPGRGGTGRPTRRGEILREIERLRMALREAEKDPARQAAAQEILAALEPLEFDVRNTSPATGKAGEEVEAEVLAEVRAIAGSAPVADAATVERLAALRRRWLDRGPAPVE